MVDERAVRIREIKAIRTIEGIFDEIVARIRRDFPEHENIFDVVEYHFSEIDRPLTYQKIFKLIKEIYTLSFQQALEYLKRRGKLKAEISAAEIPSDYPIHTLTRRTLEHMSYISDDIKRKLKDSLTDGYLKGESIEELSRRVQIIWEVERHRATRLARTITNEVYNQGHLEAYSFSGVVKKVEYIAALDKRTSEICRRMHGSVWEISDPSILKPPLHFNCRSRLVPYFGRKKSAAKLPIKLMKQVARFRTEFADEGKKFERILGREVKKRAKKTVKTSLKDLSERNRDKIIAEELWEKSERTNREFAAIVTERGEIFRIRGGRRSVNIWNVASKLEEAGIKYEGYHTHPNDVCAPSFEDIFAFLFRENQTKTKIVTRKKIFIIERTKDTPLLEDLNWIANFSAIKKEYVDLAFNYARELEKSGMELLEAHEIGYRKALKDLNKKYNLNLKFEEVLIK
jgi:SPP1 gp7 family putative phage head morphogenesis protein